MFLPERMDHEVKYFKVSDKFVLLGTQEGEFGIYNTTGTLVLAFKD